MAIRVPIQLEHALASPRVAIYRRPKIRAAFYQFLFLMAVLWVGCEFALNAKANLEAQRITSGFGFLKNTAGFGVNQSLISYTESDTYGRVFLVGLLNTLVVAGIGIVFATILGFVVGIARLSRNWLVARLAGAYVELIRNLPLLFQLLFWYLAVLGTLPPPRESVSLFGEIFLNNRGIILPAPVWAAGAGRVLGVFVLSVLAIVALKLWTRHRQGRTGGQFPLLYTSLARLIVPPLTNQYLNLTKNSSLAVAVGYPDLFAVFAGTTLHQTGQAIEIIAMTMAVYLAISLITSGLMNWYNAHIRIAER